MCIFKAHELVPPSVYKEHGERALRFIDTRIIDILTFLRDYYKSPITVNNYMYGGQLKNRGLRLEGLPFFRKYSCHSFGRAVDFNVKGVPTEQVYQDIFNMADDLKTLKLTGVEDIADATTWTHITVSNLSGWNVEENNGIKILKG